MKYQPSTSGGAHAWLVSESLVFNNFWFELFEVCENEKPGIFAAPSCSNRFLYPSFSGTKALVSRHEYLHNVMLIPLDQLTAWPQIYNTRESRLEQRHLFLVHRNRAQYDPTVENYVSLCALAISDDVTFASEIAMATVTDFNNFLKTL